MLKEIDAQPAEGLIPSRWQVPSPIAFPAEHPPCPLGSDRSLDVAIITSPEVRDPELVAKLEAVAGRVLNPK